MAIYFRQHFRACGVAVALVLLISSLAVAEGGDQRIVLLRHSTGGNVFDEGGVAKWFRNFNAENGTSYDISMRAYPDSPYSWKNYPYDYWNLWVNSKSPANPNSSGVDTLENLAREYDMIIFKHCFPGSDIESDSGSSSVSSSRKTLGNYKLQYRALRDKFDSMPETIFMVWTLAPRHRMNTSKSQAARAKQFVDWVRDSWLTEDGKAHPNIFVFDFWSNVAETRQRPAKGETNTLRYEYERSHRDSDSHPNSTANRTVGPIFAQQVVDAIATFEAGHSDDQSGRISAPTNLRIVGWQ